MTQEKSKLTKGLDERKYAVLEVKTGVETLMK